MNQAFSIKRKVMCIFGGVSYLILNLLTVIIVMHEYDSEKMLDDKISYIGLFFGSLAVAVVLFCDILCILSNSFRVKIEATERKYKPLLIFEIVIIILSASALLNL